MENSDLITKALNYIKAESKKSDISIDDVATHAGFSTDYFNRFSLHTPDLILWNMFGSAE